MGVWVGREGCLKVGRRGREGVGSREGRRGRDGIRRGGGSLLLIPCPLYTFYVLSVYHIQLYSVIQRFLFYLLE